MSISRRTFLRGALAVAGAAVVPTLPTDAVAIPRIVGDGVHDDTAGLQAALNGEPFIADGFVVRRYDHLDIYHGSFRITKTLTVRPDTPAWMYGNRVVSEAPNGIAFDFRQAERCQVVANIFEGGTVLWPGL